MGMGKKLLFNSLLYISLAFLVYFLIKFDYLKIKELRFNYFYLIASLIFLWAGFYLSTLSWWFVLKKHQISIDKKLALTSHGLSVFAKYIPGKIWVILGRASRVAGQKFSLKTSSYASLKEQLLYIWAGLLLSAVPLFILRGIDIYSSGVVLLFVLVSFLNFSDSFRQVLVWFVKKLFKKEIQLPSITFKESLHILVYITMYWFAWIIAFYLFSLSIYKDTSIHVGFIFPLSVTLGLLAIIVPGGIGVREGILTGFMILSGIPTEISVTISVISRLWFISGEVFIFLLAMLVHKFFKMKPVLPEK